MTQTLFKMAVHLLVPYVLCLLNWILITIHRIHTCKWCRWLWCDDILPKIHCRDSTLAKHLIRRRGLLNRPYKPPIVLRNGYIQTLVGLIAKPLGDLQFEREYKQVGKGVVAIDWFIQHDVKLRRNSPIMLIVPRLTGDAVTVGNLCRTSSRRGFRPVVFNRRGHGHSFLTSPRLTSTGDPSDAREAIGHISDKYPYVPLVAVGIGAGCATLFSYLGENGSSSLVKAAVCISPSYDNTEKLCKQIPKFYELFLLLDLKRMIISYWKALHKVIDLKAAILRSWTLKEFDYHVYCKLYGIDTFKAFWQKNDPMRDVDDIAVPVLCVNSLDDPVSVHENIPLELFEFYPNLLLMTIDKGGHCAFYENVKGISWAETLAVSYCEGVLEFMTNSKLWYK